MGTHVSIPLLLFFPLSSLSLGSCAKRQDVHPLAFLTESNNTRKLLPFPLLRSRFPFPAVLGQSWQAGDSVTVTQGGLEGQRSTGVHVNGTWCPLHLR